MQMINTKGIQNNNVQGKQNKYKLHTPSKKIQKWFIVHKIV